MGIRHRDSSAIGFHDSCARRYLSISSLVVVMLFFLPVFSGAQELTIPKNPLKGRFVFEQKGCITCHSIEGESGKIGPDLATNKYYGSFLELASIMWNHAPDMLRRMRELELPYPEFTRTEMAELIAYLYYLRYLGEPGDLYRGKMLVKEKQCLLCHSIAGKGGDRAPAFDKLAKYISPLYMARALWNHGPEMEKQIKKMGLERPMFEKGDIVDLSAYIREASKGTEREQVFSSPGNPQRGRLVFGEKGCLNCHAVNGDGKDIGPNLKELEWDFSVTEIAGLMWNHGSEMWELMQEQEMSWPRFAGNEMADIIAYLYFLKFTDDPGDPDEGQKVFTEKACGHCHGADARGGEYAPDLSESKGLVSAIDLVQIIWNHAPVMEEKITEKVIRWPEFSGEEMRNVHAFLQHLVQSP